MPPNLHGLERAAGLLSCLALAVLIPPPLIARLLLGVRIERLQPFYALWIVDILASPLLLFTACSITLRGRRLFSALLGLGAFYSMNLIPYRPKVALHPLHLPFALLWAVGAFLSASEGADEDRMVGSALIGLGWLLQLALLMPD